MEILYPSRCPFCKHISKEGICAECRAILPYVEEPCCMKCGKPLKEEEKEYCRDCARVSRSFEQGKSVWTHTGKVPQAVYRFKFHNKRYYAQIFAAEMAARYGDWIYRCQVETIIPVPLHPAKQRKRGFNQAKLLAYELGRKLELPVCTDAVFRIRNTKPQKELGGRERQDNLKGAFAVSGHWKAPKTVLLVDDIYTTGSTIHRIAKVLKKTGVEKVYFLTISIGQDK